MGLFDKKICSICGGEIGLLGNRKLEDGNLCKDCARKLSPWFSERRHSTIEEIKEHLAYREENKKNLAGFNPTKTFGEKNIKVLIDEKRGQFIATGARKWEDANPDLVSLSQVKDCKYEIEEDEREIYDKDEEGNRISFDPPKYEYSYEFEVTIDVDSPYFSEIEFEFSDDKPSSKDDELYKALEKGCRSLQHALLPGIYGDPMLEEVHTSPAGESQPTGNLVPEAMEALTEWKCPKCGAMNNENFCTACGTKKPVRWFCGNCGRENSGNFCTACGKPAPAEQQVSSNQEITREASGKAKAEFHNK